MSGVACGLRGTSNLKRDGNVDEVRGSLRWLLLGGDRRVDRLKTALLEDGIECAPFKAGDEEQGQRLAQILDGLLFGVSLRMHVKYGASCHEPFPFFGNGNRQFCAEFN